MAGSVSASRRHGRGDALVFLLAVFVLLLLLVDPVQAWFPTPLGTARTRLPPVVICPGTRGGWIDRTESSMSAVGVLENSIRPP